MTTRRKFIFQIIPAAAAVTALGSRAVAAPLKKLDAATNPAAKALGYVTDTKKANAKDKADVGKRMKFTAEQDCANCSHFTAANSGCALFAGYSVEKLGWCKSWIPKK
ncbi:MAG: high-potential iron-sulfur protein [Neisseria sp.]|nr:high-potential iron-sulfur protein [Neisseria sp.]